MSARVLITIHGAVQGVGFRPFIYRLAREHKLAGYITNTCSGVVIDVQGANEAITLFQQAILRQKPERAKIAEFTVSQRPPGSFTSFQIGASESGSDKALALLPDTAMCRECLRELFDPENRRYGYPFLHCISCGPRFSLFLRMPFDRGHTTMTEFSMCAECLSEYDNPENRRFYSQTNCCPKCGPKLQAADPLGNEIEGDPLSLAASFLGRGKIVAMKNTGGYLLLVDAANEEAVERLRERKKRKSKPFALLMPNPEAIAEVSLMEKEILTSPAAPIVLLRKRTGEIAPSVSKDSPYYGVMLPHNALQHLLLHHFPRPLVATSGNSSGKPLCITEEEAFETLASIADLFLIHNRKISHRLDDSIVHVMAGQPVVIRRARGYTPSAIPAPGSANLFAAGSHMKNSFAFLKRGRIYMSQYIGDLDSADNCRAYEGEIDKWERLLGVQNLPGVGDKHPGYYSSRYLEKRNLSPESIQHHQAHVFAAMLDNNLTPPLLGISWDGTGWGDDETIWGGEAFLVEEDKMHRLATLYPFPLPGGEKGVLEPRRALLGLFFALDETPDVPFTGDELSVLSLAHKKKINSPLCSSMGRLFDAVSALLGLCLVSDFEGQAALMLEAAAYQATTRRRYDLPLINEDLILLDWRPMIRQILQDKKQGVPLSEIAMAFHETLAQGIVALARMAGQETVALTGGVMQNKLLVEKALPYLKAAGFKPYIHRDIPPNDGGIAAGQLAGRY